MFRFHNSDLVRDAQEPHRLCRYQVSVRCSTMRPQVTTVCPVNCPRCVTGAVCVPGRVVSEVTDIRWRMLIQLGWSVQKPEKRGVQRDEAAIARWRLYTWPALKSRQQPRVEPSSSSTNLQGRLHEVALSVMPDKCLQAQILATVTQAELEFPIPELPDRQRSHKGIPHRSK